MLDHDIRELTAIFIGGALGTLIRTALATLSVDLASETPCWPWPTFIVNIVGAFLLGYFTTRVIQHPPLSSYRRPLLGTGFCGGLTTFSTMQVETIIMIEHHHYSLAGGYTAASIVTGLVVVRLATVLARRVEVGR